jgi:hypothetical protein
MTVKVPGSNTTSNSYTWAAPYGGSWSTAANWQSNGTTATSAPGAGSTVIIANTQENDITGSGSAASLQVEAYTVLFGTVSVSGATYVGSSTNGSTVTTGPLELDQGTLTTGTLIQSQNIQVGTGSRLTAGSINEAGYGTLRAQDGGKIQTGTLISSTVAASFFVDGASSLEIGTLGNATLGALTIDSSVSAVLDGSILANVVDNGRLSITDGGATYIGLGDSVASAGTYSVTGSGTLVLNEMSQLTIEAGTVSTSISFSGPDSTLDFLTPATISGAITGFTTGDQIMFGNWVTGISWSETNTTQGTLTLRDNGTVVGHLILDGNYSGDTFHLGASASGTNGTYYGGEALTVRQIGTAPTLPTQINGTSGHDTLTALASGETLTGGAGNDLYMLNGYANLTIKDTCADLNGTAMTGLGGYATMTLDLTDLSTSSAHATYVLENQTAATLTLSDGTHISTINLFGSTLGTMGITSSDFTLTADGHGGTNVTLHL